MIMKLNFFAPLFIAGLLGVSVMAAPNPNFHIFLLIGQSNMEGVPAPDDIDLVTDPRVQVLSYAGYTAPANPTWMTASPPLHSGYLGVGPGDYFAKTLVAALPAGDSIGLVPCAISGVDIDFFRKGITSARRNQFTIQQGNDYYATGAYQMVLDRAKFAQERGVIEGILFHQGESNMGQATWVGQVREIVTDLRTDLGLPNLPFVAGELLYKGCCSTHNFRVKQIPDSISYSAVVSAALDESATWGPDVVGLPAYTGDTYKAHFNLEAQRELGRRYAKKMIPLLPAGTVSSVHQVTKGVARLQVQSAQGGLNVTCAGGCEEVSLLGLDGKVVQVSQDPAGFVGTKNVGRGLYTLRARNSRGDVQSRLISVVK
jgi:hypothetical protein